MPELHRYPHHLVSTHFDQTYPSPRWPIHPKTLSQLQVSLMLWRRWQSRNPPAAPQHHKQLNHYRFRLLSLPLPSQYQHHRLVTHTPLLKPPCSHNRPSLRLSTHNNSRPISQRTLERYWVSASNNPLHLHIFNSHSSLLLLWLTQPSRHNKWHSCNYLCSNHNSPKQLCPNLLPYSQVWEAWGPSVPWVCLPKDRQCHMPGNNINNQGDQTEILEIECTRHHLVLPHVGTTEVAHGPVRRLEEDAVILHPSDAVVQFMENMTVADETVKPQSLVVVGVPEVEEDDMVLESPVHIEEAVERGVKVPVPDSILDQGRSITRKNPHMLRDLLSQIQPLVRTRLKVHYNTCCQYKVANMLLVYSRTLFVGGVTGIKEDDLRDMFARYGYVQSCILNNEKRHAFIKMYTREDAIAAKEGMASYKWGDITIRVRNP